MLRIKRGAPEAALVKGKDGEAARSPCRMWLFVARDMFSESVYEEDNSLGWPEGIVRASVELVAVWARQPCFSEHGGLGHCEVK